MGISGRYEGEPADPRRGREVLHLRVDVDPTVGSAPVLNVISGDIFERNDLDRDRGKHVVGWRIEVPANLPTALPFTFAGPATRLGVAGVSLLPIRIHIPQHAGPGPLVCTVDVTMPDGLRTFTCERIAPAFRTVQLAVDFCTEDFRDPDCKLIPASSSPPQNTRTLSLVEVFQEAGVELKRLSPVRIEDTSKRDGHAGWTTPELDASLETRLKARGLHEEFNWPRWFVSGLLADSHADGHLGVMFDDAKPNRQGFAVFAGHRSFAGLPGIGEEPGAGHAEALRLYFFTWVHEIGHGFNLEHSSMKGRPGALSWMNDQDALANGGQFWVQFPFAFDEEEIDHIRHGYWREVVMGALPLGRGGHLSHMHDAFECSPAVINEAAPPPPLRLRLLGGGFFDFMRPVTIEVELRNSSDRDPVTVSSDLRPESGMLLIAIDRPDGRTVEYTPPVRTFGQSAGPRTLPPHSVHREKLHLTYGRDGFCFDVPGQYVLRAVYVGNGRNFIVSNPLRLRIGIPRTHDLDRVAQDFFEPAVGRCLYFGGSRAPHLKSACDFLTSLAVEYQHSWFGADLASVIADGVARPFRHIDGDRVVMQGGDRSTAAALTKAALDFYRTIPDAALEPRIAQLHEAHTCYCDAGQAGTAIVRQRPT